MASDQCGHPDGCNNHINRVVVLHPKETAKITAESLLHLLLYGYFDYKEPMQKTGLHRHWVVHQRMILQWPIKY